MTRRNKPIPVQPPLFGEKALQLIASAQEMLNGPLAPLPPRTQVRTTDPRTSHEAASLIVNPTKNQQRVLDVFASQRDFGFGIGLTDHELLIEWRKTYGTVAESTPRKRRCDLVRLGLIHDSGRTRPLIERRNRVVWVRVAAAKA